MKTKKINAVRECSLFGINYDILNTTTLHNTHTFQFITRGRLTLIDDTIK